MDQSHCMGGSAIQHDCEEDSCDGCQYHFSEIERRMNQNISRSYLDECDYSSEMIEYEEDEDEDGDNVYGR